MTRRLQSGFAFRRLPALVLGLAVSLALVAPAPAFTELKPAITENQAKILSPKVSSVLRSGGDLKQIDEYFLKYYFRAMTGASPEALGQLGEMRTKLFRQYLDTAQSKEARDHLNGLTIKAMGAIAKGDYHPAVRYNAALILGQLTTEAPKAGGSAPAPLAEGTETLLSLLESDEFKGVPVTSSLRLAALVSLERHAQRGVDPKFAPRILKAALAVAATSKPTDDVSQEVHDWIRGQAVRVLAAQESKGATQPTFDAIAALLADDKINIDQRCRIAKSLRPSMFSGAKDVDADPLAKAVGAFAKTALGKEAKEAKDYEDKLVSDPSAMAMNSPGGYGRGGGYGGGFDPTMEELGPRYENRRALDRIMAVASVSQAVAGAGKISAPLKEGLEALHKAVIEVADLAVSDKVVEGDVAQAVIDLSKQVATLVDGWSGGAAAPAADKKEGDAFGG